MQQKSVRKRDTNANIREDWERIEPNQTYMRIDPTEAIADPSEEVANIARRRQDTSMRPQIRAKTCEKSRNREPHIVKPLFAHFLTRLR
jgi:hypothetical protein